MNTDSPASSQPIGLRGWWPATTKPTTAVTRMITSRPATDQSLPSFSGPVRTADRARKPSSATITPASTTVIIRWLGRERAAGAAVIAGPRAAAGTSFVRRRTPSAGRAR